MVERINQGESEIRIELIKRTSDLSALIDAGMRTTDLVRTGVSEFLTSDGDQVRVTMLTYGTFVHGGGEA
jgi:hypothetical protein